MGRKTLAAAKYFETRFSLAFALLCLPCPLSQAQLPPKTVNVRVHADQSDGSFPPIWNYWGYDEPNYTYTANGKKLLSEFATLSPVPVYIEDAFSARHWPVSRATTVDCDIQGYPAQASVSRKSEGTAAHLYLIWTFVFRSATVASLETRARMDRKSMRRSAPLEVRVARFDHALVWAGMLVLVAFCWGCSATVRSNSQAPGTSTFAISGSITPPTSGAMVTLSGSASATATANSTGAYSFTGLGAGSYAVTPSNSGFTFSPTTQAATITTANVSGLNFAATAQTGATANISGSITPTAGGSGATVLLSGPTAATTTANASGSYTFTGLPNGTYTVTPNEVGFAFTPVSQNVTLAGVNQTGLNFVATPSTAHSAVLTWTPSTSTVSGYNVYRSVVSGSGYAKLNSALVASFSYSDSTVQSGTTYFYVATSVDSGGDESTNSNEASAAIP
jgi:carboxypeptidase family protein